MGLRRFVVERLGRDVLTEVAERAAEKALAEAHAQGAVDPDEHLWRSVLQSKRDLPKVTHEKAVEVCYTLYQQEPLGHRITELNRDYTVGDGITFAARNPEVEEIIGEFWHDDDNDLDQRQHDFALELGLYGELIPEVIVSDVAGVVKLGYIDPSQVKGVQHVEGNPLVLDVVRVQRKGFGIKGEPLEIVRRRGEGLDGRVFFFKVNSVSNSTRGWPDLLHIADWLDVYSQLLINMADRGLLIGSFIWDVLLKGADDARVREWLREHGEPPRAGSVRAHNEQVEWNAVAPERGSFETAKEAEVLLEHIAGGAGLPKHWLSSAEDVNRATALEMGAPTVRRLAQRQRYFTRCLHRVLRFVLAKAEEKGRLRTEDGKLAVYQDGRPLSVMDPLSGEMGPAMAFPYELVEVHAPEISPKDMASAGDLIAKVASALLIAENQGWIPSDRSKQVLALLLGHVGYDYEPSSDQAEDEGEGPGAPKETEQEPPSRAAMEEGVRAALAS